ncbi:MAG: hypothetical protein WC852_06870 [Candidatus Nanoarchaeia archaeon]|jgi:hypothetical protein
MNAARKEFDLIDRELFSIVQSQLRNVKKGKKIKQKKSFKAQSKVPESQEISKAELKSLGYENDPAIHRIYTGILKKKR